MNSENISPEQQEQYLQALRQQQQQVAVQEMVNKMSEKCFKLCAGNKLASGSSSDERLESSEATCVVNCMDRYMETMGLVQHTIANQQ